MDRSRDYRAYAPARHGSRRATFWRRALLGATAAACPACAPTVNVMGAYFPGSVASATIGVVASYLVLAALARRPDLRPLAQSGLLFVGLAVLLGSAAWWTLFRGF